MMNLKYKEVAFEIANNDKFYGIGITLEDLELIMKEAEELFRVFASQESSE